MPGYRILTFDEIAVAGLERLARERYEVADDLPDADAILVRSRDLHDLDPPPSLRVVARAGVGVNNIPVARLTAPGANANAVEELVIAGMLLAARNLGPASEFARSVAGDGVALEHGKKRYRGFELADHTLGVLGLGAIGTQVANAARAL